MISPRRGRSSGVGTPLATPTQRTPVRQTTTPFHNAAMSPGKEDRAMSPTRVGGYGVDRPQRGNNNNLAGSPYYAQTVRTPGEEKIVKGATKILLVGVCYRDDAVMSLPSAVHDVRSMQQYLTRAGFTPRERRILTEDNPALLPTRTNILASLRWLVRGAVSGDSLFFHFSGHGGHSDGYAEDEGLVDGPAIAPVDYQTAGLIHSEELFDILAGGLPAGVRLTCLVDCVKPGSCPLDLPFRLRADDGGFTLTEQPLDYQIPSQIVMMSNGGEGRVNSLTTAYIAACNANPGITYRQLVVDMTAVMRQQHGFSAPRPLLSSSRGFEMNDCFSLSAMPEGGDHSNIGTPPTRKEQELARRLEMLEKQLSEKKHKTTTTPTRVLPVKKTYADTPTKDIEENEVAGASKAVVISVTYNDELDTAGETGRSMQNFLMDVGFNCRTQVLSEKDSKAAHLHPTRANIITSLKWLSKDATPGDVLLLYFCGYGSVMPGYTTGLADAMAPVDFETRGFVTGDEVHSVLLRDLPEGVKVLIIADCAQGGTFLKPPYKISMHGDALTYQHEAFHSTDDTAADVLVMSVPSLVEADDTGAASHPGLLTESLITVLSVNPMQRLLPMLRAVKTQLDNSVKDLSPVVQSSYRLDERSMFYLGNRPQNLKPRQVQGPDHPKITPMRDGGLLTQQNTQQQGIAGVYRVENSTSPAAVAVDGGVATLFSIEVGEKRGKVTGKGVELDEGGVVVYDCGEGTLRFEDGMVWVKQSGGGNNGGLAGPQPDPGVDETQSIPMKKPQPNVMGASKALIISMRYVGTRLQVNVPSQETTIVRFLQRQGFNSETKILSDTVQAHPPPTRNNIMSSLRWLVSSAVPGDSLFLVVSGRFLEGCIAAGDYDQAGGIDIPTFQATLLPPITSGVKLTILFDFEETGDVADLPYQLTAMGGGGFTSRERPGTTGRGDVVTFSSTGGLGYGNCAGVMTSFMSVLNQGGGEVEVEGLLVGMRDVVKSRSGDSGVGVTMGSSDKTHPGDIYTLGAVQRPLLTNIHPTLLDPKRAEGTARAVLISASYSNKLPNAEAALNDIKSLLLRSNYPSSNIRTLTDTIPGTPHPTKGNILASLRWLTNATDPGDHLFLYFTGYGSEPPTHNNPLPPRQNPGIAPTDWMTQGLITPQELSSNLLASAPPGVYITGVFDTVYTVDPIELPYMLTCEREGGTAYTNLPVAEHPASAVFLTTAPDMGSATVAPLNGVLTSAFVRTMAGCGKPPSLLQMMYGVNAMLGGMVRGAGQLPRLVSSRRFTETDVFSFCEGKKKEPPVEDVVMSPPPASPQYAVTASSPSSQQIDDHMRQIQQSLNAALSMTKSRVAAAQSVHRSPPRSPSPPQTGSAGFLHVRTLLLTTPDEPLGMRLNPDPRGMVVTSATPNSAAQRSGIAPGDVIASIVGYPVRSSNDVRQARLLASRSGMLEVQVTMALPQGGGY